MVAMRADGRLNSATAGSAGWNVYSSLLLILAPAPEGPMMAVRRAAFMPPVTPASTRAPLRPRSLSPRFRNSTSSRSLQGRKGVLYISNLVSFGGAARLGCCGVLLSFLLSSQQVQRNSVTAGHWS